MMVNKIILFLNIKEHIYFKMPVGSDIIFIEIKVSVPVLVLHILKVPVPELVHLGSVKVTCLPLHLRDPRAETGIYYTRLSYTIEMP